MVLCVLGFLGLWVLAFWRSRCLVFRHPRVFGVLGFWGCAILGFYGFRRYGIVLYGFLGFLTFLKFWRLDVMGFLAFF